MKTITSVCPHSQPEKLPMHRIVCNVFKQTQNLWLMIKSHKFLLKSFNKSHKYILPFSWGLWTKWWRILVKGGRAIEHALSGWVKNIMYVHILLHHSWSHEEDLHKMLAFHFLSNAFSIPFQYIDNIVCTKPKKKKVKMVEASRPAGSSRNKVECLGS